MPEWITKYWVEWIFGVIVAGMAWAIKRLGARIKKEQAENKALRDGMKSLLRIEIENECEKCQRDKWCGSVKRGTILDMYRSYTALEGNDGLASIVQQTMALPAIEPEHKHQKTEEEEHHEHRLES